MITELIVTSAPRGLQAGRSGFTTVMRTRGIHPDLAIRLESASGYRHTYPQGDPRNPIIYSYTNTPSAAGEAWVLSRVGDAGTDYTGRSNKIAHHIALKPEDVGRLTASNPALVLSALVGSGGFKTVWQGEPVETTAPPALPTPTSQPGVCQRWKSAAGDPGWAGVLVERALNKETTWVIAPAGTDILGLFAEALALAGPAQRWQIPFTTYSLNRNEGRWLGTLVGTPEADAARKQPRALVVDLANPGLPPSAGPYVQAARGLVPPPWAKTASVQDKPSVAQQSVAVASTYVFNGPSIATPVRSEVPPPPIHVQPGGPPTLKQWPGPLPEPNRPWYASAVLMCAVGMAVLSLAAISVYRSLPATRTEAEKPLASEAQANAIAHANSPLREEVSPERTQGHSDAGNESPRGRGDGPPEPSVIEQGDGSTNPTNINDSSESFPQSIAPIPDAIDQIAEIAAQHLPLNPIPSEADDSKSAPVVVLRWPKESKGLGDLILRLPSPGGGDSTLVIKPQVNPTARGGRSLQDGAPQVVWEVHEIANPEIPLATFTVHPKEVVFTATKSGVPHDLFAELRLMPLVVTHARDVTRRYWIRLASPAQATVFASTAAGGVSTMLVPAGRGEIAKALLSGVAVQSGVLTMPDCIVAAGESQDDGEPFAASLSVSDTSRPVSFRWRPKSWNAGDGAWLTGIYRQSFQVQESALAINARIQAEHADCFVQVQGPNRQRFHAIAEKNLETNVETWKQMVQHAFVSDLLREGFPQANARDKQSIRELEVDVFEAIEKEICSVDEDVPELLMYAGLSPMSYVGYKEAQGKSPWCPVAGTKVRFDGWLESLKNYLSAFRLISKVSESPVPPKPGQVALESPDDVKKAYETAVARRKEYAAGLKSSISFADDTDVHAWCDTLISSKTESNSIRHVARLWILLNNYRADVRGTDRSAAVAQSLVPNVSGEVVLSIPSDGERISYPIAVLQKADGVISDAAASESPAEGQPNDGGESAPPLPNAPGDGSSDATDGPETESDVESSK